MRKVQRYVMECTDDECGMRRVGGQRRKGSELLNEEVGLAVPTTDTGHREWL